MKSLMVMAASLAASVLAAIEAPQAGLMMTLSRDYFVDYEMEIMDTFQDLLMGLDLPDTCPEYNMLVGKLKLCQMNRVVKNISFKKNQTSLNISTKDKIQLTFLGETAEFGVDFNINSDPEWIRDQGDGSITIKNFEIRVGMTPINVDGSLQFKFDNTQVDVGDIDGAFKGKTEIIESVNLLLKHYRQFFKVELTDVITMKFAKSLQAKFNQNLSQQSRLQKFNEYIFINTSLTGHPFVMDGYLVMPYDGTVFSTNNGQPSQLNYTLPKMPINPASDRSL